MKTTYMEKARALIVTNDNKILVTHLGNSITLPGGTVEQNEDYHKTIIREIEEEVGLVINDFEEIITINHYHENFPNLKSKTISNRNNEVHYFYKKIDKYEPNEQKLTNYERENNLEVLEYSYDEIIDFINSPSDDEYKKFMSDELLTILDYFKENNYITV